MIHTKNIPGPVLEIDAHRAYRNIGKMVAKAARNSAVLRPHFKTHQSHVVAAWFQEQGVDRCAVSSPAMAEYFAAGHVDSEWKDILIAFPAQLGAIDVYNHLAARLRLGLITDSLELMRGLSGQLTAGIDIWIEVDTGYGRTGVHWHDHALLEILAAEAERSERMSFRGLLSHAGNSYACRGDVEIESVHSEATQRLKHAAEVVESHLGRSVELSYGDTPTCSVCEDFSAIDEMRPGNFVFYDLMQQGIGACGYDDIAASMLCPVVGVYPDRGEVVVHGGAVHFSKERDQNGHFGQVFVSGGIDVHRVIEGAELIGISQEHGIVAGPQDWIESLQIGDVLNIWPVHSCLAMDCMRDRPDSIRYRA